MDFYQINSDNIDLPIITTDHFFNNLPDPIKEPGEDVSSLTPAHTFDFTSRIIGFETTFSTDDALG